MHLEVFASNGWRRTALLRALPMALSISLLVLLPSRWGLAQLAAVPADVQASLLSKLANYDRGFPARAGNVARVLIFTKPGSAKSDLSAAVMKLALSQLDRIGGLPHQEVVVPFESAAALAERCRAERVSIIYLTPGFDGDVEAIRSALVGVDVLSVAAVSDYVEAGVVLGFELESGKPRMLLNYAQAKQQHIEFRAEVLKLMRLTKVSQ